MSAISISTHTTLLRDMKNPDDHEAWRRFFDRYAKYIRSLAAKFGLKAADQDDVLQEVCTALIKAMPKFHYDRNKGAFRGYLFVILKRIVFRILMQAVRSRTDSGPGLPPNVPDVATGFDDAWDKEWRLYHVERAMERIEVEFCERDVTAFRMYALGSVSPPDVARRLNMTVNQVYLTKHRILKRLSQIIKKQIEEEG